jgi:GNAT superfamily N-acetyltransferase
MPTKRTPTELNPGDFERGLILLEHFPHDRYNLQVLLKDTEARVFVDDGVAPQVALLCSVDGKGISFVGGDPNQVPGLLDFILASTKNPPQLQFISLPSDSWRHIATSCSEARFFEFQRVSLTLDDVTKIHGWQKRVPTGFSVHRIDQALSQQIRSGWSQWFPRARQFTSQDIGFCLVHGGCVVSLACGLPVSDCMEITVETHEEFRGQGLASLCCAACVEECLRNSIKPLWSAGANHKQSISVAKKLGFDNEHFHWWLVRRN